MYNRARSRTVNRWTPSVLAPILEAWRSDCITLVDEFRAIAEPLYRRDPVVHTVELTLLAADRFPDDWFLMTVWVDGAAVGAALQTPPYPLACNGIPLNAVDSVVADLAGLRPGLDGVRGVRDTAAAFANSWHDVTGRTGTVNSEERLYRLGELRVPNGVAGAARLTTADDHGPLLDWVGLFFEEAFRPVHNDGGEEFLDNADRAEPATGSCSGTSTARR
jgi:hypothetical protein